MVQLRRLELRFKYLVISYNPPLEELEKFILAKWFIVLNSG
jgi:hypothetical protein